MTNVFTLIGTHRDDPDQLLLEGDDGAYYACPSLELPPTPVEPDEEWVMLAPERVDTEAEPLSEKPS
jgi:hypothetical protein